MKITVREGLSIGDGCPPFVIAEVGSNWATLDDCLISIVKAKQCGADAVKFQAFDHHALYGSGDGRTQSATPMKHSLPIEWLPKLAEKSRAAGIEFMCSAFSPEFAEWVNPYVNIHKVASSEMCHVRLLEKLKSFGKPVILSTGAQHVDDIRCAIRTLDGVPIMPLYCVAAYPAREINLDCIGVLRGTFGLPVGYSDHSTDVGVIPLASIKAGAAILEKHFTAIPELETPDRPHSIDPSQFRRMVDSLRGNTTTTVGPTPEEVVMILRHKRRLIATRNVIAGDTLKEGENFGIYRSLKDDTHAFIPWMIDEVNGRTAMKNIQAGDGIGPGDI